MKTAICHYSLRKPWAEEHWTTDRLVQQVSQLGAEGVDFHAGLLGSPQGAAEAIRPALDKHRLAISGLSMSNNFNQEDPAKFQEQVQGVASWLEVAAKVKAPVCRIFGGSLPRPQRSDAKAKAAAVQRIMDGLGQVTRSAERLGLLLALENHGGLPCSGQEQVEVIRAVNSPALRATIDVGNYLECGQAGHEGAAVAGPYAAYVHFKDMRKVIDPTRPRGFRLESAVLGEGEVNLGACLRALRQAGYDGWVALEYEAAEDPATALPRCVACMKKVIQEAA